ncbi:hypothetical protein BGZ94_005870, partial [Podila epigama]
MSNTQNRPRVIIVGAGIGGITLGLLLEIAGVPYAIFERATTVKPLGSAIALGCNVVRVFKQLGIWDDIKRQSKPTLAMDLFNVDREQICKFDFHAQEELGGSHMYVVSRPVLYDMLLRKVPAHRILFGKKVISISQGRGVLIRCSDGDTYEGDILVGADGAYSAVRQRLYEQLAKDKMLPSQDSMPMPFKHVALVGQTIPLDPEEYPELKREDSPFECVVGHKCYGSVTFTTKENTICWQAYLTLDKETSKINDSFRNSEWGPEAAEQMCKDVHDLPIKGGNGRQTLGDLIALTPRHLISKVVFEEKIFRTWYSGRTVLMGDACHKMHPAGGM